jgi:hypothetical protein
MNVGIAVVPEPTTGALAVAGLWLIGMSRRRRSPRSKAQQAN